MEVRHIQLLECAVAWPASCESGSLPERKNVACHGGGIRSRNLGMRRHVPRTGAARSILYNGRERRGRLAVAAVPRGNIDEGRAGPGLIFGVTGIALVFLQQRRRVASLSGSARDETPCQNRGHK